MFLHLVTICYFGFTLTQAGKIDFPLDTDLIFKNATGKNVFLKINQSKQPGDFTHHPFGLLNIVNGQPASRGQFCYQAYLQFSDGFNYWVCGGSLVSSSVILTAAHCVQGATAAVVILGGLDLRQRRETSRQVMSVYSSGMVAHENYNGNDVYNDIAVVKLPRPVTLNQYVCTVKIPGCTSTKGGSNIQGSFTISGWGKTSDTTTTWRLMYATVGGLSLNECASFYRTNANYRVIESQLCTSGSGGKSTCNGDSGGPLVQTDSAGSIVQQGIVSLGLSSCDTGAPSVYTNVNFFTPWLCPKLQ